MKRELLHRFIKEETTEEENRQLRLWFEQTTSKEEFYQLFDQAWAESSSEISKATQERIYRQLQNRLNTSTHSTKRESYRLFPTWQKIAIAAIISALVLSNYLTLDYTLEKQEQMAIQNFTVSAEKGQRAFITLPDSTKVWLNSDTRISYPANYGLKDRNVLLEGEAFFDVAKDPGKRFIVKANNLKVEALGTTFNICAYKGENSITASLLSGSVCVSYNNYSTILQPNESVKVDLLSKRISLNRGSDVANAAMWRNNELIFKGESLEEIARIMNRLYNVTVEIEDESIKKETYAGTIHNGNLQNMIDIISLTTSISYEYKGDTLYLRKRVR